MENNFELNKRGLTPQLLRIHEEGEKNDDDEQRRDERLRPVEEFRADIEGLLRLLRLFCCSFVRNYVRFVRIHHIPP